MRVPLTPETFEAVYTIPPPTCRVTALPTILAPQGTALLRLSTDKSTLLVLYSPHEVFPPGFDPARLAALLPATQRPTTVRTRRASALAREVEALREAVRRLAPAAFPCPFGCAAPTHVLPCPCAQVAAGRPVYLTLRA